ncbi:MAG: hypothetical protein M3014_11085 [Chloroflexota bacterium]|nr:hypothetical protein [Chloroflexota bacterium]
MKEIAHRQAHMRLYVAALLFTGLLAGFGISSRLQSVSAATLWQAQSEQCGLIQERGAQLVEDTAGAQQAELCFLHAYGQRLPATLVLQIMGIDTVGKHTLALGTSDTQGGGGQYGVTDTVEFRVVPRPQVTTTVYNCSGLLQSDRGLVITGCGQEGDLLIPVPLPLNVGTPGPPTTPTSLPTSTALPAPSPDSATPAPAIVTPGMPATGEVEETGAAMELVLLTSLLLAGGALLRILVKGRSRA